MFVKQQNELKNFNLRFSFDRGMRNTKKTCGETGERREYLLFSAGRREHNQGPHLGQGVPAAVYFSCLWKLKGFLEGLYIKTLKQKINLMNLPNLRHHHETHFFFLKRIFSLAGLYNNCISKNKKCLNTEFTYVFHFTWFLGEWRLIDDVLVAGVNVRWRPLGGDGVPSLHVLEQSNIQVFLFWIWFNKKNWFKHLYWRNV